MTTSCFYLWILRGFSGHFSRRATLGNCLFHVEVAEFQAADAVKNISQALFKHFLQERAVDSKAFFYLKSPNFICKDVNS